MFRPGKIKLQRSDPAKKPLSLKDLIISLVKLGFRYYKPVSSVWKMAFVSRKKQTVLCVLIRKNGIDLRYYDNFTDEIKIMDGNSISMQGGEIYRNHYNESKNLITQKIRVIASTFRSGKKHENLTIEDGRSYMSNPNFSEIRFLSNDKFHEKMERMIEAKNDRAISDCIREGCGSYHGDVEWL